jgi:hypothetical protein
MYLEKVVEADQVKEKDLDVEEKVASINFCKLVSR